MQPSTEVSASSVEPTGVFIQGTFRPIHRLHVIGYWFDAGPMLVEIGKPLYINFYRIFLVYVDWKSKTKVSHVKRDPWAPNEGLEMGWGKERCRK